MDKLSFGFLREVQIRRKLVITNDPLSPLFPFVSSIELIESISNSPFLHCNALQFMIIKCNSNLNSISF